MPCLSFLRDFQHGPEFLFCRLGLVEALVSSGWGGTME